MNPPTTDPAAALPATAADIAAGATAILSLKGDGYTLFVSKETIARKSDLVAAAGGVTEVTDNEGSALAMVHVRHLAAFRNEVEKARTEVKKPVLELGRKIDAAAADFVAAITAEEGRLKKLVGTHAEKVAAEKRAAEAEERRKLDEARRAKEEAERAEREAEAARQKAADAVSIQDAIKAKQAAREAEAAARQAEEEKQAARREQMAQSAVVASTSVASGVRFEPDFEVIDAAEFLKAKPDFCEITVKRRETLAWLKTLDLNSDHLVANCEKIGLRVTLKPVVR